MGDHSIRLADLRVSKLAVAVVRYVYPPMLAWALIKRHRSERIAAREVEKLGSSVAQVVIQAQVGAQTLRRLTYAIVLLTAVNTGFVVYSALK